MYYKLFKLNFGFFDQVKVKLIFLSMFLVPGFFGYAFGHTVDSVEDYRLEIGWMNEPVVSGETNGIVLFVSPLLPGLELRDQVFHDGVVGLEKSLKLQLVFEDQKIMLSLKKDHNIAGKYYAFVNPTVAGFYQANIIGNIGDTKVSLSMHPPKVDERAYIEFPESANLTLEQLVEGQASLVGEVSKLEKSVSSLEESDKMTNVGYAGMGLGITGIIIASVAIFRSKKIKSKFSS